ncbi:cytochrome P450 [Microbispora sp. NPDC049125]|uniref:cytochrome P450 n=1 Tax=Microbispora sp. NPDC049125 TaxID=3154929 RepID=UPI003465D8F8
MTHRPPTYAEGLWRVSRHADVRAVLADPRFVVPAPPPAPPSATGTAGMGWLRSAVSRFANGPEHARRRARAGSLLAPLDLHGLRAEAFGHASAELSRTDPIDVMDRLARRVPVGVLSTALGVPEERREDAVAAVTAIAAAYHPPGHAPASGDRRTAEGDRGVAALAALLGHPGPERLAAVAGLLVQACDATAGLIGTTLILTTSPPPDPRAPRDPRAPHGPRGPAGPPARWPVEALLAESLRYDPPVRLTRRTATVDTVLGGAAVPAGAVLVLDLAAANRDPHAFRDPDRFDPGRERDPGHLGFGGGLRPCPGDGVATALAAGVVEAARGHVRAEPEDGYEPSPNLRVHSRLILRRPGRPDGRLHGGPHE